MVYVAGCETASRYFVISLPRVDIFSFHLFTDRSRRRQLNGAKTNESEHCWHQIQSNGPYCYSRTERSECPVCTVHSPKMGLTSNIFTCRINIKQFGIYFWYTGRWKLRGMAKIPTRWRHCHATTVRQIEFNRVEHKNRNRQRIPQIARDRIYWCCK